MAFVSCLVVSGWYLAAPGLPSGDAGDVWLFSVSGLFFALPFVPVMGLRCPCSFFIRCVCFGQRQDTRRAEVFSFVLLGLISLLPATRAAADDMVSTAIAQAQRGAFDDAYRGLTRIIEEPLSGDNRRAHAYNARGIVSRLQGDSPAAVADFSRAIEVQPLFAAAYSNRGLAYAKAGLYAEAVRDLTRARVLEPRNPDICLKRGNAYFDASDYEHAISDYSCAVELQPDLMRAYYNRCDAHERIGHHEAAISDCRKAVALDPSFIPARIALEWLLSGRTGSRPCFCN